MGSNPGVRQISVRFSTSVINASTSPAFQLPYHPGGLPRPILPAQGLQGVPVPFSKPVSPRVLPTRRPPSFTLNSALYCRWLTCSSVPLVVFGEQETPQDDNKDQADHRCRCRHQSRVKHANLPETRHFIPATGNGVHHQTTDHQVGGRSDQRTGPPRMEAKLMGMNSCLAGRRQVRARSRITGIIMATRGVLFRKALPTATGVRISNLRRHKPTGQTDEFSR